MMEDIDEALEGRLLEVFKGCVQSLLREKDSQRVILDDTPNSQLLCFLLEKILSDGIKKTFFGSGTLFDLVDNLPSCIPGSAVVQLLNTIKDLSKSSVAKSRLFIRLALNEGDFVDYISSLIWNEDLLKKYYLDNAIVRNEESVSIFLMLLEPLKTAQFKLFPLAKELEMANYWETYLDKKSLDAVIKPLLTNESSKPIPMIDRDNKSSGINSVSSINGSVTSNSNSVGSVPNTNKYGEEIDVISKNKKKTKKVKKKKLVSIQDASDPSIKTDDTTPSSSFPPTANTLLTDNNYTTPINRNDNTANIEIISFITTTTPSNDVSRETKIEMEEEDEVEEDEEVLEQNLSASADEIQEILNKLDDDLNVESEYIPSNTPSSLPNSTTLLQYMPVTSTTISNSNNDINNIQNEDNSNNNKKVPTVEYQILTTTPLIKEDRIFSVHEEVKNGVIKDTYMSFGDYKIWKSVSFIMKNYHINESYIKEVGTEEEKDEATKYSRDNWVEEYYAKLYLDSPAKASNSLSKSKYCAGNCGNTLNNGILKKANYCHYTCLYYCDTCHKNEKSVIPSKLVQNWDRNEYTVAVLPKKYLDKCQSKPLINLNVLNANLYDKITLLEQIKNLRSRLVLMGEFIKTCRNSHNLMEQLNNRKYLLDSIHVYSAKDLIECKTLMAFIMTIMESYVVHITEKCETCKGKGFYCEICKSNELLFSFQIRKISKCPVCKALYHNNCVKKQGYSWKCIKCVRRDQLNQRKSNNTP